MLIPRERLLVQTGFVLSSSDYSGDVEGRVGLLVAIDGRVGEGVGDFDDGGGAGAAS